MKALSEQFNNPFKHMSKIQALQRLRSWNLNRKIFHLLDALEYLSSGLSYCTIKERENFRKAYELIKEIDNNKSKSYNELKKLYGLKTKKELRQEV